MNFETISLEGTPDEVAARMLASSQPRKFLDELDISTEQGIAELLLLLIQRSGRASVEKDELIRFVERNRHVLESSQWCDLFKDLGAAAQHSDESLGFFFSYIEENVQYALSGASEKMDMRSDKLFWLIYALGQKLETAKITYGDACTLLHRQETAARISRHQLIYMLQDYAEATETSHQVEEINYILIAECGLIIGDPKICQVALEIISAGVPSRYLDPWRTVLERTRALLKRSGHESSVLDQAHARLSGRRKVDEDDF